MNETTFRSLLRQSVVDYWNGAPALVKKFGKISKQKVYVVWQSESAKGFKALARVKFDDTGYYFEFVWDNAAQEATFDVYKKQKQIVVQK